MSDMTELNAENTELSLSDQLRVAREIGKARRSGFDEPPAPRPELEAAALAYAAQGWYVFPLHSITYNRCSCGYADCGSPAKHPRTARGFHDATADSNQIAAWWTAWPDANIGIATGKGSGIVVLDVDEGGSDSLEDLIEKNGTLPETLAVQTGTGLHYYFAHPGRIIGNSAGYLGPNIDVRGDGGYVVAPPSVHYTGAQYTVLHDAPLAPWPEWLDELKPETRRSEEFVSQEGVTRYGQGALQRELAMVISTPQGARNDRLNEAAFNLGQLVAGGHLTEDYVRVSLHTYAERSGLNDREIEHTIQSGIEAGFEKPRWNMPVAAPAPVVTPGERELLKVYSLRELKAEVEGTPDPGWLLEGLWPADAYGVLGAAEKTGKTWASLDMAVSVASGGRWFQHFKTREGPVLYFLGEGGKRNTLRRIEAICLSRGVQTGDVLDVLLPSFETLRVTDQQYLDRLYDLLEAYRPILTVIDPWYLSAAGTDSRSIDRMGEALYPVQQLTQEAGTALVVWAHWNKTGMGEGTSRIAGTGLTQWGRVIGSGVNEREAENEVLQKWYLRGGEIPDSQFRVRRHVISLDPTNLASPFSYEAEVTQVGMDTFEGGLNPNQKRVLSCLELYSTGATVTEVQRGVAEDNQGKPLSREAVSKILDVLEQRGLSSRTRGSGTRGDLWFTEERVSAPS